MLRLALLCVWSLSAVQAYFNFQQKIPNGDQVPHPCQPNMMWQGVGHKNVGGGGFRNSFGVDFAANKFKWDRCLCERDSDSDGRTNGEELGDPECMWSEDGIPQITDMLKLSHPGVCEPANDPKCMQINDWSFCEYDEEFECETLDKENAADVIEHEVRFPVTPVPAKETTYFCMTFDLPDDEEYHLVASEPILDNRQVMHHIIMSGCDESEDGNDDWKNTEPKECGMGSLRCQKMLAGWTVGGNGECAPKEYGIRVGKKGYKTVSMQMHWNNPEWKTGMTDSSGLKLYLTKNLRPNDGAVLTIGSLSLVIPPRMESVSQVGTCHSTCTKKMQEPILYVKDFSFHMHYLGRSGVFEHIQNGSVVNKVEAKYYNYDNPEVFIFEKPLEFHPGDELKITCNYKSTSKSDTTYYGDGTSDEMCFGFITYFPAVKDFSSCSSFNSVGTCSIGYTFEPLGNCNTTSFFASANTWMGSIMAACPLVQGCTDNCRGTVETLKRNEPCLQGDKGEFIQYFVIKEFFGEYGKPFIEAFNLCHEGWDRRIIYGNPKPKNEGSNVSIAKPTKPPMTSHHGDGDCVLEGDLSASAGTPWASIVLMDLMLVLSAVRLF